MKTPFPILYAWLMICLFAFAAEPAEQSAEEEKSPAQSRAEKIIIPKLDFRESTVRAAFDFLYLKSRQLDPEGIGINIILSPPQSDLAKGAPLPPPGAPDGKAPAAQQPAEAEFDDNPPITLLLEKVSVADAITRIAEAGGMRVRWDEYAAFTKWPSAKGGEKKIERLKPRPKVKNNAGKDGERLLAQYTKKPIVPRIDFRESTVRSAVDFLILKQKTLDNDGAGINIVLRLDDAGGADAITLSAGQIPLLEALRYIAEMSGLEISYEPMGIFLTPAKKPGQR